jgi:hypothetical protein
MKNVASSCKPFRSFLRLWAVFELLRGTKSREIMKQAKETLPAKTIATGTIEQNQRILDSIKESWHPIGGIAFGQVSIPGRPPSDQTDIFWCQTLIKYGEQSK